MVQCTHNLLQYSNTQTVLTLYKKKSQTTEIFNQIVLLASHEKETYYTESRVTLKLAQFCDDPKKISTKSSHPKEIFIFFLKTKKKIEIQNFEPKKIARAYVCVKTSEYPPPPPPPACHQDTIIRETGMACVTCALEVENNMFN